MNKSISLVLNVKVLNQVYKKMNMHTRFDIQWQCVLVNQVLLQFSNKSTSKQSLQFLHVLKKYT